MSGNNNDSFGRLPQPAFKSSSHDMNLGHFLYFIMGICTSCPKHWTNPLTTLLSTVLVSACRRQLYGTQHILSSASIVLALNLNSKKVKTCIYWTSFCSYLVLPSKPGCLGSSSLLLSPTENYQRDIFLSPSRTVWVKPEKT